MNSSTASFALWAIAMIIILVGMVIATRRSKESREAAEDVASKALPEIGKIAEKKFEERFGRAPVNSPSTLGESWYPEAKKRVAKANVR